MKPFKTALFIFILFSFASSVFTQQNTYEIITHEGELYGKALTYKREAYGNIYDTDYGKRHPG